MSEIVECSVSDREGQTAVLSFQIERVKLLCVLFHNERVKLLCVLFETESEIVVCTVSD